jgi:hypothetical protein
MKQTLRHALIALVVFVVMTAILFGLGPIVSSLEAR